MRRLREIRLRLLARSPECSYCGVQLNERNSTIDHVTPRVAGGTSRIDNLTLACRRCNNRKGGATAGELVNWVAAVVAVAGGAP